MIETRPNNAENRIWLAAEEALGSHMLVNERFISKLTGDDSVSFDPGKESVALTATISDGGIGKIGNGDKYVDISIDTRPVVCIGGDHPYNQLWGRNGKDGLAQMYADHGIVPYIALNTRSLTAESVGSQYFMGWDKVKTLADAGMIEPVAHGARHYQDWECPDAGIHVKYTGPAATATMYVTSTGVVGTTAGSVEDFSFLFADYPQIDQLVAAIDALPNWSAMRSPELTGTELSKYLLTVASGNAKDCKSGLPDTYGRRFSMAGGIRIFWDSTVTPTDRVELFLQTTHLNVVRDGVTIGSFALASYTLSGLITAVKALNTALASVDVIAGRNITSLANDNAQYFYCDGSEDATNLTRAGGGGLVIDCKRHPAVITGCGLTPSYLRQMNIMAVKADAAANGVPIKTFVQSGGNFWSWLPATIRPGVMDHFRGDARWNGTAPCAMPLKSAQGWHSHICLSNGYNTDAAVDALVDSIIASKGHIVDILIHNVLTDAAVQDGSVAGSSGYYLPGWAGDINEAQMVRLLRRLRDARDAGLIRILQQSDLNRAAASAVEPQNMLYNPSLVGRVGANMLVTDTTGKQIPGWRIDGFSLDAIDLIDNGIKVTMSASVTQREVATQRVVVERGKRYRGGFRIETENGTASTVAVRIRSAYGDWPDSMGNGQLRYIQGPSFGRQMDDVYFDFEIPWSKANGNPRTTSQNAGPYNLSTNKNVQIGLEGSTAINIDCSAGAASTAAVTASEVAAAINAAIKADAQFAAKPELWTLARAENGRVVLESVRRQHQPIGVVGIALSPGASASATVAIFGGTGYGYGYSNHGGESDVTWFPVEFAIYVGAPNGVSIKVRDAYLRPFNGGR